MIKETLLKKIAERDITVGVVGLGYVGLPLAVEKAKAGFKTIGFDVQEQKVEMVNKGINYIGDVVNEDLEEIVKKGLLSATNDFSFIKDVDFVAICVPTPLDIHQQPDISYVKSSTEAIAKYMKKGAMIVASAHFLYQGFGGSLPGFSLEKRHGGPVLTRFQSCLAAAIRLLFHRYL